MADIQKALATQVKNIETRTGKTLEQLIAHVQGSGLGKHSEIVSMLKSDLGLGHGDANTIAHLAKADAKTPDSHLPIRLTRCMSVPKQHFAPFMILCWPISSVSEHSTRLQSKST